MATNGSDCLAIVDDLGGDDNVGWVRATPRRRQRRRGCPGRITRCGAAQRPDGIRPPGGLSDLVADDDLDTSETKLRAARRHLLQSDRAFVDSLLLHLSEALLKTSADLAPESVDILCLGLGNPATDRASLRQLALLDLLIEREPRLSRSRTRLYDPVFRQTARSLIGGLNMQVLTMNCEACYPLDGARHHLVFLPHCAPALLNNLLFTNWSYNCISRLVLYANGWPSVRAELAATQEPDLLVTTELAYICRLEPALFVFPGPCNEAADFEGLRVQCFPASRLQALPPTVWEPVTVAQVPPAPLPKDGGSCNATGQPLSVFVVTPKDLAKKDRFYADFIGQEMVDSFIDVPIQSDAVNDRVCPGLGISSD